jgi:hypothetical protein
MFPRFPYKTLYLTDPKPATDLVFKLPDHPNPDLDPILDIHVKIGFIFRGQMSRFQNTN